MKYDLILYGKNEFYPKLNSKTYNILLVDNQTKIDFMMNYFNKFIKTKTNKFIGIDFEFNKVSKTDREVALCQINLETDNNDAFIFVFNPNELQESEFLIYKNLLTNNKHGNTIKILHGSESLDVPYLFQNVLKTQKNINDFLKNFYDTKYLCEFNHIENEYFDKCSIYDLLLEQKILTQSKKKELEAFEDKTGPIYLVKIDIHKMNHYIFLYSLYDVIYLPELIKVFLQKNYNYKTLIPLISHNVFKYKRIESFQFNNLRNDINTLNTCFIYINEHPYFLNEYYDFINNVFDDQLYKQLTQITYFKEYLTYILRYLVYKYVINNNKVYLSKNNIYKNKLNYDFGSLNEVIDKWNKKLFLLFV